MQRPIDRAFAAARAGNDTMLAALLDQGVPPDSVNEDGDTLLEAAIQERHATCVNLLLMRGANPNGLSSDGEPLRVASYVPANEACIRELIAHGASIEHRQCPDDGYSIVMHSAAEPEHLSNLAEFLKHLPSADIRNKEDESLLTYAIAYGNLEGVRIILDSGVDINGRVCNGETPLIVATGSYNDTTNAIIHFLLDRGADANLPCMAENKLVPSHIPLMTYIRCHSPDEDNLIVARRIAKLTRDINYRMADGQTALSMARDSGYQSYVELLLEVGAQGD